MTDRVGRRLLVTGLVLMLLVGPLLAGGALWLGVRGARGVQDDLGSAGAGRPVDLRAGTEVEVRGATAAPGSPVCQVVDLESPDGGRAQVPMSVDAVPQGSTGAVVRLGGFTAPHDGRYEVTCDGVDRLSLLDAGARQDAVWHGVLGIGAAAVLGGLTFLVGAVVALVGVVRVRRR